MVSQLRRTPERKNTAKQNKVAKVEFEGEMVELKFGGKRDYSHAVAPSRMGVHRQVIERSEIEYKPGWGISAELVENYAGANPPRDKFFVAIQIEGLIDVNTGEDLSAAVHRLDYTRQDDGRWYWDGERGWSNQPLARPLPSVEACLYDAIRRFELHELQHWLKVDGMHVVPPHE